MAMAGVAVSADDSDKGHLDDKIIKADADDALVNLHQDISDETLVILKEYLQSAETFNHEQNEEQHAKAVNTFEQVSKKFFDHKDRKLNAKAEACVVQLLYGDRLSNKINLIESLQSARKERHIHPSPSVPKTPPRPDASDAEQSPVNIRSPRRLRI